MSRDGYEDWPGPRTRRRSSGGHRRRDDSWPGEQYPPAEQDPYPEAAGHPDDRRDSYAGQDPYGQPGQYGYRQDDPYGQTDPGEGRPDPYGQSGQYGYRQDDPYGPADHGGGQPGYPDDAGYGTDSYSGYRGQDGYDGQYRRDAYPDQAGYADQDYYGGQQSGYDSAGAYQDGYRNGYGSQDGYQSQDGYDGERGYPSGGGYDDSAGYRQYPATEQAGWEQEDDEPRRGSRSRRYAEDEPGPDRRRGAGRRSARGASARAAAEGAIDADDDRHSGFFSGFPGDDDEPPRRGRGLPVGLIALVVIVAILATIGGVGYHYYDVYKQRHISWSGNGYGSVTVIVRPGDTGDKIAAQLVAKGVVGSVDSFASYVASNGTGLQPGEFRLHKHMGNAEAWTMLTDGKNRVNSTVTIPDGLRYAKILPILAKDSNIPLSKFQAAIKDTAKLGLPSYAHGNPEGYLYPATYDIVPGSTTALQILQMAVQEFNKEATSLNLASAAAKDGFTAGQVITGASLLEAEVGPKYYKDVARVIDNRLNYPMNLNLDSTIAYATGKYTYNLSQSDLNVNSPYNTRTHAGLPPGPIDSPDAAAIEAFLHPASSSNSWLYFVTVNKAGLTQFTSSLSVFNTWSAEAQRNGV